MVEYLSAPAALRARAELLDRAIGLPAAVPRRLDRLLGPARAALAGQPHRQPPGRAGLELHRSRPLSDRQQHPLALAQLALAERNHAVLPRAPTQARHIALDVLHARLPLLDEPDQPPQIHPR